MNEIELQKLNTKLNIEYGSIGSINVSKASFKEVRVTEIRYNKNILSKIDPLVSDEPIVVARNQEYGESGYIIIDGYHRFKNLKDKHELINVIFLESYHINRKSDSFLEFLEKNIGSNVMFLSDEFMLVNGKLYEIETNEGCGGCSNGWSSLELATEVVNKTITIQEVTAVETEDEDVYNLFINGMFVAEVNTGYGNGCYGGDFSINLFS